MPVQQMPLFELEDPPVPTRPSPPPPRRTAIARDALGDAVERFQPAMRLKGFTQNTIDSFDDDLRLLVRFLGPRRPVGAIGHQDLTEFMDYLLQGRGKPCNAKSYARRLTTLKVFFGWLAESEMIAADPAAGLIHKPVSSPLPPVLVDDDVDRLMQAGQELRSANRPDTRPILLFRLLLETGIKKAECMSLKLSDVESGDNRDSSIVIRYSEARNRHKERRLALGPGFATLLREFRAQYHPQIHLFECTHRNLEYVLRDLGRAAGVQRAVSFETVRMTCAVRDFRRGVPPEALRVKLGLSRISWEQTLQKIERLSAPAL